MGGVAELASDAAAAGVCLAAGGDVSAELCDQQPDAASKQYCECSRQHSWRRSVIARIPPCKKGRPEVVDLRLIAPLNDCNPLGGKPMLNIGFAPGQARLASSRNRVARVGESRYPCSVCTKFGRPLGCGQGIAMQRKRAGMRSVGRRRIWLRLLAPLAVGFSGPCDAATRRTCNGFGRRRSRRRKKFRPARSISANRSR